jgi:hypothetical protein
MPELNPLVQASESNAETPLSSTPRSEINFHPRAGMKIFLMLESFRRPRRHRHQLDYQELIVKELNLHKRMLSDLY